MAEMMDYLLSDRQSILDGALLMMIGYQYGQGNLLAGLGIAVVGIVVIAALQTWWKHRA